MRSRRNGLGRSADERQWNATGDTGSAANEATPQLSVPCRRIEVQGYRPQPAVAFLRRATQGGQAIMAEYKQAGDLVPDDLYIRRRRLYYRGPREQIYRVITTRPATPPPSLRSSLGQQ